MQEIRKSLLGKPSKLSELLKSKKSKSFNERNESKTIFVGNLPFSINEKILENSVI